MLFHKIRTKGERHTRLEFALAFTLLFPLMFIACPGNGSRNQQPVQNVATNTASTASPSSGTAFDANRAFEHVRKQVEFGPRPAGSAELARTRDYIIGELKSYGLNVRLDEF